MLPKRIGHFKLRILRLEDNNLRTLPGDFQKLVKLQELTLARNRMGSLALITPLDPPKSVQIRTKIGSNKKLVIMVCSGSTKSLAMPSLQTAIDKSEENLMKTPKSISQN